MAGKKPIDFELPKLRASCAHEGCQTPALVREKTETGWANLCEYHYVKAHTKRAEKWCADHGLHTRQQKIEYCRRIAKGLFKPMVERVPGEDDEEKAA